MASKARDLSNFISTAAIDASEIGTGAITTDKIADTTITHAKLHTTMDLSGKTVTLPTINALDVTNNINVGGTVDGVDIQTLNTTAGDALPKAGGAMTGGITSTSDITVGNAYISSGYSQFANLRVPNNGYIGTPTTVNALQIQSNGNIALTGTVTATSFTGSGAGLTNIPFPGKNFIINGGFTINQRAAYTSATAVGAGAKTYVSDRWAVYVESIASTYNWYDATISSVKRRAGKVISTGTGSSKYFHVTQQIEYESWMEGRTITISGWVRTNLAGQKFRICDGVGCYTPGSVIASDGNWAYYSAQHTLPADVSNYAAFQVHPAFGLGTFDTSTYLEWSEFKVEFGSTATAYEHRSHGEELALCQRYFYNPLYNMGGVRGWFVINYLVSSGNNGWITFTVPFPVKMRVSSTFSHSLTPAKFLSSAAPGNGADQFSFYIQNQGYSGLAGNGSIANLSGGGVHQGVVGTYYVSPSSTSASHIFIGNGCTFQFNAEF